MPEGESTTSSSTNEAPLAGETPAGSGGTPESFDAWLAGQDASIKALIDGHVAGLKSSLESERGDRKSVAAQLKALQAEGDPAKQKAQIAELQASLAEQETRTAFAEEAFAQGVTNVRLAYLAAKDGGLVGRKDVWAQLKEVAPELFRRAPAAAAAAGNGSGAQPGRAPNMNELLRGR